MRWKITVIFSKGSGVVDYEIEANTINEALFKFQSHFKNQKKTVQGCALMDDETLDSDRITPPGNRMSFDEWYYNENTQNLPFGTHDYIDKIVQWIQETR